jgi:hypothetical protein
MDPDRPLHPNLARIAAEYDELSDLYATGRLDADEARRAIAALAARDDNGTIWSIDPASGDWVYRNVHGELVPGMPPSWGYATPTAYDVTRDPARVDPRHRVVSFVVEDHITSPPGSLSGSTRVKAPTPPRRGHWWLLVVGVAAVVLGWWLLGGRGNDGGDIAPAAGDIAAAHAYVTTADR